MIWDENEVIIDVYGTMTVSTVGEETVQIVPMIFNYRIVIGTDPETGYSHGWCYQSLNAALLALRLWDPWTEAEPLGYKKKATPGRRKPPCTKTTRTRAQSG